MKHDKFELIEGDPKRPKRSAIINSVKQGTAGHKPTILKQTTKNNVMTAVSFVAYLSLLATAIFITFKLLGSKPIEGEVVHTGTPVYALEQPVVAETVVEAPQQAVEQVQQVTPTIVEEPIVAPPVQPDYEAEAKAFIYQKESNNNPAAVNHIGCRGLGQACPGTKLPCGNDYACQDAWFTNYMLQRYGSWTKAKEFWLARVPINGADVGHWW